MLTENYSVDILVNGKPVTKYQHEGDTYIEGRPGSSYSIKIRNNTWTRVKAVVSVDGLSVMDGKPASEDSSGYIIDAKDNIVIKGWRTSDSEVAKFVFGSKKSSYSAKIGEGTTNVGVIGVMLFQEFVLYGGGVTWKHVDYWPRYEYTPYWTCMGVNESKYSAVANNPVMTASASLSNSQNLGTGFGEEINSEVTEVGFNSVSTPSATYVLYYDDRRGLEARGIVVDKRKLKPNPFPKSSKYCQRV